MSFTYVARIIAIASVVVGSIMTAGYGVFLATGDLETADPNLVKIAASSVDNGVYAMLFGIVLGVLTDISRRLESR